MRPQGTGSTAVLSRAAAPVPSLPLDAAALPRQAWGREPRPAQRLLPLQELVQGVGAGSVNEDLVKHIKLEAKLRRRGQAHGAAARHASTPAEHRREPARLRAARPAL